MKKLLKLGFKLGLAALLIALGAGLLFLQFSPQFGARDKAFSIDKMVQSKHFDGEIFENLEGALSNSISLSTMRRYFGSPNREPDWLIPVQQRQLEAFQAQDPRTRLTWFGHSAVLLEIDGKRVFIDPMLSSVPAPLPWLAGKRFNPRLPLKVDDIPALDAIVVSHDHYDHLDYQTIARLKERTQRFFVPLGVGSHLHKWGVPADKIVELDWWESAKVDTVEFTATPAKHFSGRGLTDRDTTLWASWVIIGTASRLFFSGDSGYTDSFKEIGERYGPFDLAMVECGQYDRDWSNVHMFPEEAVQTNQDLNSELLLPIHWGAFSIAAHTWDDPIKRATEAARRQGVRIATPMIGETITLGEAVPSSRWWEGGP